MKWWVKIKFKFNVNALPALFVCLAAAPSGTLTSARTINRCAAFDSLLLTARVFQDSCTMRRRLPLMWVTVLSLNWQDEGAVFNWWILREVNGTIYSIFFHHCSQLETANDEPETQPALCFAHAVRKTLSHLNVSVYTFSMNEIHFARRNNNNFRSRLPQTCEHVTIRMMWFLIYVMRWRQFGNSARLFCMP